MRTYRKFIVILAVVLLILSTCLALASAQTYGLSKDEIITIQTKLKNWGYYAGNIDGIYGSQTTAAVKYFQSTNGLFVDGIVGDRTAEKLGMQLEKNSSTSSSDYSRDAYLLARVVYGEARGESYRGKVAVAAVVLNRVESPDFPNTIALSLIHI